MADECIVEYVTSEDIGEYATVETVETFKEDAAAAATIASEPQVHVVVDTTTGIVTTSRPKDPPLQTFCVDKVNRIYRIQNEQLSTREAFQILDAHRKGQLSPACLTQAPLLHVKGGHIYVYELTHPGDVDYLCDSFHFNQSGRNVGLGVKKLYYVLRTEKKVQPTEDFARTFTKVVYKLKDQSDDRAAVIIQYYGDETLAPKRRTPYCFATTDCKQRVRREWKKLSENSGKKSKIKSKKKVKYGFLQKPTVSTSSAGVTKPETTNDCNQDEQSLNQPDSEWETLDKPTLGPKPDELDALKLQNSHLSGFINTVTFTPRYKYVVCMDQTMAAFAQHVLDLSSKDSNTPQLITYHSSYQFGHLHISMLTMRNIKVEGEPVFPVAFFIHDVDVDEVHDRFWRIIMDELKLANYCQSLPICASRSPEVRNAILKNYPNCNLQVCQSQLLKEITTWLKQNSKQGAVKSWQSHLEDIMDSATKQAFVAKYNKYKSSWAKQFSAHVEKNFFEDIIRASLFSRAEYAAFKLKTPVNSISELVNRDVLKLYSNWNEAPLDYCIIALCEIQMRYFYEFRESELEGKTKTKFQSELFQPFGDCPENMSGPIEKLLLTSLAKLAIRQGLVNLDPVTHTFNVKNVENLGGTNIVNISLKGQDNCTCGHLRPCYHIVAAYFAVGWQVPVK